jgi:hypothetical protein
MGHCCDFISPAALISSNETVNGIQLFPGAYLTISRKIVSTQNPGSKAATGRKMIDNTRVRGSKIITSTA